MSAATHTEWLSLIESTGPFLAVWVLDQAMPAGLDALIPYQKKRIRSAYEEWCEAVDTADPRLEDFHREWIRLVLEELLEYDDSIFKGGNEIPDSLSYQHPQTSDFIRPDFIVTSGEKPQLFIATYPPETDLESPLDGEPWAASPLEGMTLMCRAKGVPVGLVTNGERWTLVGALSDGTTSYGSWFARIWLQEPITLQAFQTLLSVRRCFGPEEETLEMLFTESLKHRDEVTDSLGEQVRRAIEVLIQALDRADLDRDRNLLQDVSPKDLYDAGLTVMMRLVFILYAEERKLLLLGEPAYDQHYAVSTLRSQLLADAEHHGLEVLERRHDAWSRLLAVFRGVFAGIDHPDLRLPALGGSLFDPDNSPFLEGRATGTTWKEIPAIPLPIDNRTVLMLLSALQVLEVTSGAQHLSYEALDVEQIGHVYEGLLERTAERVPETTLGLVGTAKFINPNIPLRALELAAEEGDDTLATLIREKTGRSKSAISNASNKEVPKALRDRLLSACGGDKELYNRILPFANHLRTDNWDDPLVYRDNAFIVTLGAGRRETGTHYTPKSLTEPIVQHTLAPLVYVGPAEGKPEAEWKLKSPEEILELKVCDMAMGSGAFLVQACRYLGGRLAEAWNAEQRRGKVISLEGVVLHQNQGNELLPADQGERILIARRLVSSRCLYGVDINQMAVELAKLSLWLVTMIKNRPFGFLDHALKCGDSLFGVSSVQQIENFSLRRGERQVTFATADLSRHVEKASAKRRALEELPSSDHTQIERKNLLHFEAEAETAKVKSVADCLVALELRGLNGNTCDDNREDEAQQVQMLMKRDADASAKSEKAAINQLSTYAQQQLRGRRPFHWALEFPEVFDSGGFDAFVGNPPFLGGLRIAFRLGDAYHEQLRNIYTWGFGTTDLCVYFLRRSCSLLRPKGTCGMVLSDIVTQGDSREAGLSFLKDNAFTIYCGRSSRHWPGTAGVKIINCHLTRLKWLGEIILDEAPVKSISSQFRVQAERPAPFSLEANKELSFSGHYLLGQGFLVTPKEAEEIIQRNRKNQEIIFDYIKGDELNNTVDQTIPLKAINFGRLDLEEVEQHYPEALAIVRERVKPQRDRDKQRGRREKWWRYAGPCPGIEGLIDSQERIILQPYTAKYVMPSYFTTRSVYAHPLVIIADARSCRFACLQCTFHTLWVWEYCSTNLDLLAYTASRVLRTFPFPEELAQLDGVGALYEKCRDELRLGKNISFTEIYNRFHDRAERSEDIAQLRALHVQMDHAVATAYGWTDLDLGHGFHATQQGERYTLSEPARREVLDRLLALNHERYEEEVAAGLHDKNARKRATKRKRAKKKPAPENDSQQNLF